MTKEIEKHIGSAVGLELKRAKEMHGSFNSSHEAFAVLQEEIDEVVDEIEAIAKLSRRFWEAVKENDLDDQEQALRCMKVRAEKLMIESVHAGAMVVKALESVSEFKEGQNG